MKDTIFAALFCAIVCGVLITPVHGTACGLEHCMKCEHGQCTECHYGWKGVHCTERCQEGCWLGGCEQHTGRCIQCSPGLYTDSCDRECPQTCRVSSDGYRYCNRTTGHCLEGCEVPFWGFQCEETCSHSCEASVCEQRDGACLEGCTDGWYGMRCNKICPNNCLYQRCSLINGHCSAGCKHGFKGMVCTVSCTNCIDEECTYNDITELMKCTNGCKKGWTSDDCKQRCNTSCQHGICDKSGICISCADGFYGDMCQKQCSSNCKICEKTTGNCLQTKTIYTTMSTIPKVDDAGAKGIHMVLMWLIYLSVLISGTVQWM